VNRVRGIVVIFTCAIAAAAPTQALAAGTSTSQITPTAPSRLDQSSQQRGQLPMTGANLLPETLIGVTLVGAGVGLRARRKW
jgi:LPXTG-motif cell wall-anchored protein